MSYAGRKAESLGLGREGARVAQAVLKTEGALNGKPGDDNTSFGPYQFHQGGMLDAYAHDLGVSNREAAQHVSTNPKEAIDWALAGYLGQAIKDGMRKGLSGSDLATYAQETGQRSEHPEHAGRNYDELFGAGAQATGQDLDRPSQFSGPLPTNVAYAACGMAAAIAFARRFGKNPTWDQALDLAKQYGWTEKNGMAGAKSEVDLMRGMGVPATLETTIDPTKIAHDVAEGNPVTVSTPNHYFTIDAFDPARGLLHVGTSGTDMKGGSEWMSWSDVVKLGGQPDGVIYADSPITPGRSVASGATPSGDHGLSAIIDPVAERGLAEQATTVQQTKVAAEKPAEPFKLDPVKVTQGLEPTQTPGLDYDPLAFDPVKNPFAFKPGAV